jgi:hypothetical protein
METVGITVLFIGVILAPGVAISLLGWKITRKTQNVYLRILIRSFILSTAFTPTIYGHAGVIPAVWMMFIGSGADRFTYSLIPIVTVWLVGSAVACSMQWGKNRMKQKSRVR